MKRYRLVGIVIILIMAIIDLHGQNFTPVSLTGFNQDCIAEGGPSSLATTTKEMDAVASNKVMYSNAFKIFAGLGGGGLPDNGTIVNGAMTFQLADYTSNNALFVYRNETKSLNLLTPATFTKIRVLCFATEANVIGGSLVNIRLTFTDASSTQYVTNYNLADWFNGASNNVLTGFGRCSRVANAPWGDEGYPTNPRMYYIEIILTCTDSQKQLASLDFSNITTAGANAPFPNEVFLAVSGIAYSTNITPSSTPSDCSGPNGTATVTVTGNSAPYSYSWNTIPVQTTATATGLAPGTYTCTITDVNGCILTQQVTVALNNNAVVSAAANPASICPGGSSQLTATPVTGNFTSYVWNPGNIPGQSINVSPGPTTTYTVSATNSLGCTASAQVTVTVNSLPAGPVVIGVSICTGTTATMNVSNPQAGFTYSWYDASTGGTLLMTGTTFTTPILTNTTTYYVEAMSGPGCISATRTPVTVVVNSQPAVPTVNGTTICSGNSATLNVSGVQPGYTYSWYDAATGGVLLLTGTSYTTPILTNTATYYVEATSGPGCISVTRTPVTVFVNSLPAAPAVNGITICPGTNATFNISGPQPGFAYSWYDAATGGILLSTGTSYTLNNVTAPTTIYVQSTNNSGCTSAARTAVTVALYSVLATPVVTVSNVTTNSVTFTWGAVPGASGYEVSTNGGASFQQPSSGTTGTQHAISGLIPLQTVSIIVRALGIPSCRNSQPSSIITATTKGTREVFVPNVFTPNNDGRNDILYVYGNFITSMTLKIFNQWGELIFVSKDKNTGWNGAYKNIMQPVGVYAYVLVAVLNDGTTVKKQGSINLIR